MGITYVGSVTNFSHGQSDEPFVLSHSTSLPTSTPKDLMFAISYSFRCSVANPAGGWTSVGISNCSSPRWGYATIFIQAWARRYVSGDAAVGFNSNPASAGLGNWLQMRTNVIAFRGVDAGPLSVVITGEGNEGLFIPATCTTTCGTGPFSERKLATRYGALLYLADITGDNDSLSGVSTPSGMTTIESNNFTSGNISPMYHSSYQLRQMGVGATAKTTTASGDSQEGWAGLLFQIAEPYVGTSD